MLISLQVSAQNFKYGVTGNVHKGSIVNVHDRSIGKWGGGGGVFAQWSLVENDVFDSAWLYFTPSLEYNMGGEFAEVKEGIYGKQKYYNDYVSVQAYIKYFFHRGNMKSDIFLFAGPRVEFLVRDKKEVALEYDETHFHINKDDVINKYGFGASAGAGVRISDYWETFIRYDHGFSKVYPNKTSRNTYNRMLMLGVNYYISRD